ncbi:hypothetical protein OROMI_004137 [Orobanche minor]
MKVVPFSVFLLLALIVLQGSEFSLADECSIQIQFQDKYCEDKECDIKCDNLKGRKANGQCVLIDTCFCRYAC